MRTAIALNCGYSAEPQQQQHLPAMALPMGNPHFARLCTGVLASLHLTHGALVGASAGAGGAVSHGARSLAASLGIGSKGGLPVASITTSARTGSNLPPVSPPPDAARAGTADLADVFMPEPVDVLAIREVNAVTPGLFKDYGGIIKFSGQVSTVKCYENNPLVRQALGQPGKGRVLVVDGGASFRCALLGDQLAESAVKNGWSGIIVNGCIRDSEVIGELKLGVKALCTHPLKSSKRDPGLRDVPVSFGGVTFKPGDWVYADKDGILVSPKELKL